MLKMIARNKWVSLLKTTLVGLILLSPLSHGLLPSFQTVLDQPSTGEVRTLFQDDKGYMWIGARNILLKYDAYDFKPIQYYEETEDGPKARNVYYVTDILQDSDGDIWITSHSGLFLYDADQEILVRPTIPDGADSAVTQFLSEKSLQAITQLPSGRLALGGLTGLLIFDKNDYSGRRLSHDPNHPSLADNSVFQIMVDSQQRIWITNHAGLQLLNEQNYSAQLFVPDPQNPKIPSHNTIASLVEHDSGLLVASTEAYGLYVFDPQTQEFTHYLHDPEDPSSMPAQGSPYLLVDSKGIVWMTRGLGSFSWFHPEEKRFTNFNYVFGDPGCPLTSGAQSVFEDRNGDIWLGQYPQGVSVHDRSSQAIQVLRPNFSAPNETIYNPNVLAVMENSKGDLWMAVGNAVSHFNRKTGRFKHYTHQDGNYGAYGTLSGYVDKHDRVWIGTWQSGYHRYNPETDRFDAMPANPDLAASPEPISSALNDATIWTFCETRDNGFWIGTHNAGISRYDANTGTFTRYRNHADPSSLSNNIAWSCLEDSKGRFWIGTAHGLSLMNREQGTFKNYRAQEGVPHSLRSSGVLDVFEDKQGRIWLGTNDGLHLYREESDDFEAFTTDDGFADAGIRGITSDPEGNLWLGTNNGIARFNPTTKEIRNFTEHSGADLGIINTGAITSNDRGEVIFGSTEGLIIVDTTKLSINKTVPPVVLTDFKLFTKSVPVNGPEKILTKSVDQTDLITLDYTKRMFSFEFSALNYRESSKNQFAYMLEGFDKDWLHVGDLRKAQYTNISAGDYVFKVKASNNDGVWNESGKSIKIRQLPPPWQTWWAYSIYATICFLILANFVRSQKRKREIVEEQNRLLEIKVAERTADLAAKNDDIQAMLSNMRQGLFTINADQIVHHEYSKYLESIFETNKIAGRRCLDLLFKNSDIGTDVCDQIETSFASIIGLHEMNFDFNYHLLLKEYTARINDKEKILSLEWSPIIKDQNVVKLMVSVRDITELKELQLEAAEKRQELSLVSELISVDSESYIDFMRSSKTFLAQNRELIESNSSYQESVVKTLFRNMHTLKGNSRTYGFSLISNAAHDAESIYSQLKDDHDLWQPEQLLVDLSFVEQRLKEYNNVYEEVLGKPTEHHAQGITLETEALNEIQKDIVDIQSGHPELYKKITRLLNKAVSSSIQETLARLIQSLPSIASELGKAEPNVNIVDNDIRVKKEAQSLLQDVFAHVLRNSIDHGIETPNQRQDLGKDPVGNIAITLKQYNEQVAIVVTDDGGGLNIERLFLKGLERGMWTVEKPPKISAIAALVFESEMSTKDQVSSISGRGVGMDAVKAFLTEAGGGIELHTESDDEVYSPGKSASFVTFETRIVLPQNKFVTA